MSIKVFATIVAKPEHRDFVMEELLKLPEPSRLDKGCIGYTLYADAQDVNTFVMDEEWASLEDLDTHGQQVPLNNFKKVTAGMLVAFNVNVTTKLK